MRIRIRKDALDLYVREHTDFDGSYLGEDHWEQVMEKIAGKLVEVDTEVLFKHEFNTKPIKNVSEEGIRIMEEYVEEVINDLRIGKAYCDLCGSVSISLEVCSVCGSSDYLEPFFEELY